MTALATASLAVVAWIIARIALASGSRGKSGLTAIAAPPTHRFSSVYVAGSRSTVTRTGLVRIAVRPGSPAGFLRAVIAPPLWPARPPCQSSGAPSHAAMMACAWEHTAATADTELPRACRCRDPGTGPLTARLVAGQRRAGQRGDDRGRG
jgi:hypothetical protein